MSNFYAQPYDIEATGFYFDDYEEYQTKSKSLKNSSGLPVEEFEIQVINLDGIDYQLCEAMEINQANLEDCIEAVDNLEDHDKEKVIIWCQESNDFSYKNDNPDNFEIDIYYVNSMKDLAYDFVEEGLFGEIPEHLSNYIDYDAIARDLEMAYSETVINGQNIIYRMP